MINDECIYSFPVSFHFVRFIGDPLLVSDTSVRVSVGAADTGIAK